MNTYQLITTPPALDNLELAPDVKAANEAEAALAFLTQAGATLVQVTEFPATQMELALEELEQKMREATRGKKTEKSYGVPAEGAPCSLCGEWVDQSYFFNEGRPTEKIICTSCYVAESSDPEDTAPATIPCNC